MAFKGLEKFYEKVCNNTINNIDNILESNKAINKLSISDTFGVIRNSYKQALDHRIVEDGSEKLWKRLGVDPNNPKSITNMQRAQSLFYHRNGDLALGRIAGVGFGGAGIVSGAYSIVANGSPVRDRNGDFDVPGIPLI